MRKNRSRLSLRRIMVLVCAAVMMLALAAAVLPVCRDSLMALGNDLFARSEAVNAYLYERFPVPVGTDVSLAVGLCGAFGGAWMALAFLAQGCLPALGLAFVLAAGQAYLGLSFPATVNAVVYALLALAVFAKKNRGHSAGPFVVCLAAVCLAVAVLMPGTDPMIEGASEHVRDWIGAAFEQPLNGEAGQPSDLMETRHENRRDLLPGDQAAQAAQTYRLVTVEEQQIARPHWIDYLRIALLCMLIPVLLAAPFVPFVWVNRQLRRAAQRRECLEAEDHREAVTGAFALVIGYLDALRIGDENALYTKRLAEADVPADYAAAYAEGAAIWQEAAYSRHLVDAAQRETMLRLLEQTEALLYDTADRKTRLRLKYVCCLHE